MRGRPKEARDSFPLPPRVTCPQVAVGPVEVEHGVAAQPSERLLRGSPQVVEVALLAVVAQQRLRDTRPRVTRTHTSPWGGPVLNCPTRPPCRPPPCCPRPPAARTRSPSASIATAVATQCGRNGRGKAQRHAAIGWLAALRPTVS